jgi:alkylation response protein AidB-like acyl-CoA dehydrogenase
LRVGSTRESRYGPKPSMSVPRVESPAADALLEGVRALVPALRERASETERNRRVAPDLVRGLANAGAFRMCVPRLLGGGEVDVATLLDVIETVARADGSAGWIVMIGATSGLVSGYMPIEAARAIYGPADTITGGVFAPRGKAVKVDGGYRASGRWAFGSGSEHCRWLLGGCIVIEDGKPVLLGRGVPDSRMMLFPAEDVRILDTWDVSGLRGTGSHDFEVADVFVPAERAVSLVLDRPRADGPLFRFPVFGLLALGIAAVATGIARTAIDELVQLAGGKMPIGSKRTLAERGVIQTQVAQAVAALESSRAWLRATVAEASEAASTTGVISVAQRAGLRLAATEATMRSVRAVDLMYEAAGGSAIYAASPLQRCFRDVHVVTQHAMVAPATYELTGRLFLGLETDAAML